MAEKIVSPGVFTNEVDASFLPAAIGEIGACIIGTSKKGPMFVPTVVDSISDFKIKFGAVVYPGNLEFHQNDSRIQVCHGDGILKNDRGYRFMKKIIRSPLCIFLFKNFHPDWGCGLAKKVSKASGDYHHHDLKADAIRIELIEYARSQWKLGFNTVLLGHYHQTGIVEENGNSVIFMGDWLRHFTVTRLDDNGWWQGNWDEI